MLWFRREDLEFLVSVSVLMLECVVTGDARDEWLLVRVTCTVAEVQRSELSSVAILAWATLNVRMRVLMLNLSASVTEEFTSCAARASVEARESAQTGFKKQILPAAWRQLCWNPQRPQILKP